MSDSSSLGKRDPNGLVAQQTEVENQAVVKAQNPTKDDKISSGNGEKNELTNGFNVVRPRLSSEVKPGGSGSDWGPFGNGNQGFPNNIGADRGMMRKGSFEPHIAMEPHGLAIPTSMRGPGQFMPSGLHHGIQTSPGGTVVKGLTIPVPPLAPMHPNIALAGHPPRPGLGRGSGLIKFPGAVFDETKDYHSEYHLVYLANLTLIDKIEQVTQENKLLESKINQIKVNRALAAAGQLTGSGRKRSSGGLSESGGGGDSSCEDSNSADEPNSGNAAKRRKKRRKKEEIVREFVCSIKDCGRSYG